jgi:hypothetical protein
VKFYSTIYLAIPLLAAPYTSFACNYAEADKHLGDGDLGAALRQLVDCENDPGISADRLGQLAYLQLTYGEFGSDTERLRKVFELMRRAALMGSEDAVAMVVDFVEEGVPEIGIRTDMEVSECLELAIQNGGVNRTAVAECLQDLSQIPPEAGQ